MFKETCGEIFGQVWFAGAVHVRATFCPHTGVWYEFLFASFAGPTYIGGSYLSAGRGYYVTIGTFSTSLNILK